MSFGRVLLEWRTLRGVVTSGDPDSSLGFMGRRLWISLLYTRRKVHASLYLKPGDVISISPDDHIERKGD